MCFYRHRILFLLLFLRCRHTRCRIPVPILVHVALIWALVTATIPCAAEGSGKWLIDVRYEGTATSVFTVEPPPGRFRMADYFIDFWNHVQDFSMVPPGPGQVKTFDLVNVPATGGTGSVTAELRAQVRFQSDTEVSDTDRMDYNAAKMVVKLTWQPANGDPVKDPPPATCVVLYRRHVIPYAWANADVGSYAKSDALLSMADQHNGALSHELHAEVFGPGDQELGPEDVFDPQLMVASLPVVNGVATIRFDLNMALYTEASGWDLSLRTVHAYGTFKLDLFGLNVDLDVNTNRNLTIEDGEDEAGEEAWVKTRGAIYNVNFDRDGTRQDANQVPLPDAIHFDDAGKPVAEDFKIDNAADVADITPLVIRNLGTNELPTGVKVYLKMPQAGGAANPDVRAMHLFMAVAADEQSVWGGVAETRQEIDITPYVGTLGADRTIGIEGLFFKGMTIPWPTQQDPNATTPFDGFLDFTLELRNGNQVLASDTVRLKVAPWMMLPHTLASQQVWAVDKGQANTDYRTGLGASGQLNTQAADGDAVSQWFQDHLEIGYTHRPGQTKVHSVFRLPYSGTVRTVQPKWPLRKLLAPEVGAFQLGINLNSGSYDYGGNLEVMHPTDTHKLGRIVMGNHSTDLWNFLVAQEVQEPFSVSTAWLEVGHIDEIFAFTGTSKEVAVADPASAYTAMEAIPPQDRGSAVFFATGTYPQSGTLGPNPATVDGWLTIPGDHRNRAWRYIRIWRPGTTLGQVAEINALGNGVIGVSRTWNTTSIILNGFDNNGPCIANFMVQKAPEAQAWAFMPQQGDRYVMVEGSKFWTTFPHADLDPGQDGTPAIVTVEEVLADQTFQAFNLNDVQPTINSIKQTLDEKAGGAGTLSFRTLPVLYVGKRGGFATGRSAVAFSPGQANLHVLAGRLYIPKQYGPRNNFNVDVFEQLALQRFPTCLFVEDWDLYHRNFGDVHCGSVVKRDPFGFDWWDNQP